MQTAPYGPDIVLAPFPGRFEFAVRLALICTLTTLVVAFNLTVRHNGGSISRLTHLFGSLNSLFFGKAAPIPPDHPYVLAA